jgi:hypothetical protein
MIMHARSLILVASLLATAAFQQPLTLSLKLAPDQTIKYTSHSKIQQEMMGQDFSQSVDLNLNLKTEKADKGTKVTMKLTDVKLTLPEGVQLPMSAEDLTKSIESVTTTATYDESGKSTDLKIEGDDMARMMTSSMNATRMGFMGIQYPASPLKVGDTWSVDYDLTNILNAGGSDSPKKQSITVNYTLTKIDGAVATVDGKIKGKVESSGPNGMAITIDMDTTSTYQIDTATGIPNSISTSGKNHLDFGMGEMDQHVESTVTKI